MDDGFIQPWATWRIGGKESEEELFRKVAEKEGIISIIVEMDDYPDCKYSFKLNMDGYNKARKLIY
ncbi:MAG: hypothetical protein IKH43_01340 [Bacteroidaceae bacterium]|nr:hypothetical protein [Bacteroidaceae bacterium]